MRWKLRGRSESNLLLGWNRATLTDLKTRPATTPLPCLSPETGMNPVVWSPSHSLPEPGGLRCLFVLPLIAVFSLDALAGLRTLSTKRLILNVQPFLLRRRPMDGGVGSFNRFTAQVLNAFINQLP